MYIKKKNTDIIHTKMLIMNIPIVELQMRF